MSTHVLIVLLLAASASATAESFKSWAARASREEREKNDAAALSSYSNALSSWKESDGRAARARVFCARGALREKTGDEAEAIRDYTECLAADKKNAKVFHKRGRLRMKSGDTALAIDDFYQAVKVDLRFAQAYADRGSAYETQGERVFAREDHQRACELGIKTSCAEAKSLAGSKGKAARTREAPPEPPPAPSYADSSPAYHPRFNDCLNALDRCSRSGKAFGACVNAAPACETKVVKGCCPAACLSTFVKSLNRGRSEEAAYRDIFTPGAECSAPPKEEDDD